MWRGTTSNRLVTTRMVSQRRARKSIALPSSKNRWYHNGVGRATPTIVPLRSFSSETISITSSTGRPVVAKESSFSNQNALKTNPSHDDAESISKYEEFLTLEPSAETMDKGSMESLAQRLISYNSLEQAMADGHDKDMLLEQVSRVVHYVTKKDQGSKQSTRPTPAISTSAEIPNVQDLLCRQLGNMVHTLILPQYNMPVSENDIQTILQTVLFTCRSYARDAAIVSTRVTLDDARQAQELLYKAMSLRLELDEENPKLQQHIKGTLVLCLNHVLQTWSALAGNGGLKDIKSRRTAVKNAEHLLLQAGQQQIVTEKHANSNVTSPTSAHDSLLTNVMPNVVSFNIVITAWSKCAKQEHQSKDGIGRAAAERAQALLRLLVELSQEPHGGQMLQPTSISFDAVFRAWGESGHDSAPDRAMSLLQDMMENQTKLGHTNAPPNEYTFSHVFNVLSKAQVENIHPYLDELLQLMQETVPFVVPNTILYNAILTACYRSKPKTPNDEYQVCERMNGFLEEMESSSFSSLQPDKITYQTILQAWVDCGRRFSKQQPEQMKDCANHAKRHLKTAMESNVGMDVHMINHVMASFAPIDVNQVEQVFALAKETNIRPSVETYGILLDAFYQATSARQDRYARKAEDYLSEMEMAGRDFMHLAPDTSCYNAVIMAWAATKTSQGAERANAVLDRLCASYHDQIDHFKTKDRTFRMQSRPNTSSFMTVISALLKQCAEQPTTLLRVEKLVQQMESMSQARLKEPDPNIVKKMANVVPNTVTYNVLLNLYAKQAAAGQGMDLIPTAENLVKRMESTKATRPDKFSYSFLARLYGKSQEPTSKLMDMLERVRSERKEAVDLQLLNIVLNILVKRDEEGSLAKAKDLLSDMESGLYGTRAYPDNITYSTVASAYKNVGTLDAARQAEEVLNRCNDAFGAPRSKSKPGAETELYNTVISAYAATGTDEGHDRAVELLQLLENGYSSGEVTAKPTVAPYHLLIRSLTPERAQDVFDRMLTRYNADKRNTKPNGTTFYRLLTRWLKCKAPESAERAEQVLRQKEAFRVEDSTVFSNEIDYHQVLTKWGQSGVADGPERAEALLEDLVSDWESDSHKTRPNEHVYMRVLLNYFDRNSPGDATKAQVVLDRMIERFERDERVPKPDRKRISLCMNLWAHGKQPGCDERAEDLLNRSIEIHKTHGIDVAPDVMMYNAVLKACAHCPRSDKSSETLDRAIRIFSAMKDSNSLSPTPKSYAFMFRIIHVDLDSANDRRDRLLRQLFKDCCNSGNLSMGGVMAFRIASSDETFRELLNADEKQDLSRVHVKELPAEWSRHSRVNT